MKKKTPYQVLGLKPDATPEAVQAAYRKRAMKYHPDRNVGDAKARARFDEVQHAYDVLKDPERRARYDRTGDESGDGVDRTNEQALSVIAPLLAQVLTEKVNGTAGPGAFDLIAALKTRIVKHTEGVKTREATTKKALNYLTEVRDRLTVAGGGPNVLADVIAAEVAAAAVALGETERDLKSLAAAVEFLDDYKYRTDGADPFGGTATMRIDLQPAAWDVMWDQFRPGTKK